MAYFKKSLNESMVNINSYYTEEEMKTIRERSIKDSRSLSNYIRSIVVKELRDVV